MVLESNICTFNKGPANNSTNIKQGEIRKQVVAIDSDPLLTKAEKAQLKQGLYSAYSLNGTLGNHSLATTVSPLSSSFYPNDTVESVVGKVKLRKNKGKEYFYPVLIMISFLFRKCIRRVTSR